MPLKNLLKQDPHIKKLLKHNLTDTNKNFYETCFETQ